MSYLPRHATAAQACEWLESQTHEPWALPRLLENGLMPWFWLDYTPGWPNVFGERHEGYLAPMVFTGDTLRLEADAGAALVTMTRTHEGALMKVSPGMRVALEDLRFKREDIQALADAFKPRNGGTSDEPEQPTETETAQERQTRRLAEFRAAGGREPTNDSGRWKGVGKAAERMGISRQALTDDLKAAVEREREQRRGGGALDPARLGWMK